MITKKEKVKDFPTLIFLMIFDFWAGTVCSVTIFLREGIPEKNIPLSIAQITLSKKALPALALWLEIFWGDSGSRKLKIRLRQ